MNLSQQQPTPQQNEKPTAQITPKERLHLAEEIFDTFEIYLNEDRLQELATAFNNADSNSSVLSRGLDKVSKLSDLEVKTLRDSLFTLRKKLVTPEAKATALAMIVTIMTTGLE